MSNESEETNRALVAAEVHRLRSDFDALERKFDDYVLKIVFESHKEQLESRLRPIERLLYGVVGLILMGVVTALLATVVVPGA